MPAFCRIRQASGSGARSAVTRSLSATSRQRFDRTHIAICISLLCFGVLQQACKDQPTFSKAEVTEETQRLETLLASKSASECQRPPLRGQAAGTPEVLSGAMGLSALVDLQGPHKECLSLLQPQTPPPEVAAMLADYAEDGVVKFPTEVKSRKKPVAQIEKRTKAEEMVGYLYDYERNRGRPYYARASPTPEPESVTSLRLQCSGITSGVREAVSRKSSCSPASLEGLLEGRITEAMLYPFVQNMFSIAYVLAAESRALLRDGHPLQAAQLLLDGMRLGDDFSRGRVAPDVELVAQATAKILFGQLAYLVVEAEVLDPDQLQAVYEEFRILIDTQTAPSDRYSGEELWLIKLNLSALSEAPRSTNVDEVVLALLGLEYLASARYEACPSGSSYLDCIHGWESLRERITTGEEKLPFVATKSEMARKKAREIVAEVARQKRPMLRKAYMASGRLAALEFAMRSMRGGACPAEILPGSNIDVVVDPAADEFGILVFITKELQMEARQRDDNLLLRFECPREEKAAGVEAAPELGL